MVFRTLTEEHYGQVATIYKQGLDTGIATFETVVPSWQIWDKKYHPECRIGIFESSSLLGWAAVLPVSARKVYSGVAEVSIYISSYHKGKSLGYHLLKRLITETELQGIYSLQSSIFRENEASIKLHLKCGFRVIGYKEKIARRNGKWYDNILMERRSAIV